MKRFARKIAWILVLAMIITLLPADLGGMTKTVEAGTIAAVVDLNTSSAGGTKTLTLENNKIYRVLTNLSYTGNNGYSPIQVANSSTAVIYVAKGCKLYVKGGNASGQWTAGQPGIKIPSSSTLIITGEGTVQAVGGNGNSGYNGGGAGGSSFNGKKANSMWFGSGGSGGAGGAGAGAGIGGAGGSGGSGGGGGAGMNRTTDPGPFKWNGNNGGGGGRGGNGAAMGNLYVLGTVAVTATGGSRGSSGGAGGGDGWPASDAGSGFSNDYRTGKAGGGGGGGYGNAATAIGGGAGGGGGGGGGGTGGGAVNAGYPAGDGGGGGYNGGGRGKGYRSSSGGYSGAYGGAGGGSGSAGGNGLFYKASTASVSGRTANETKNSHSNIEYQITIDSTGKDISGIQSTTMTYGASLISQIPVPSRKGYTLGGFYTGAGASGKKYFDATGIPDLSLLKNDNYADSMGYWYTTSDLKVYPEWIPNKYTLICNATGGSGGGSYAVSYDDNLPTVPVPSKVGYKFAGFYSGENGTGTQYVSDAGAWLLNIDGTALGADDVATWKNKIETVNLYAKWVPIDYAIQLYSDGQYIEYEDEDTVGKVVRDGLTVKGTGVKYGTFTLPSAEDIGLKKTHYNFLGWNIYDEQDWAMYKAGTVYRGGLTTRDEDVVSVYAAWEIMDNYAIIYNGNGGTKVPGAENAFDGDSYTIPDVTPQRTGYTFMGWSEDADCHPEDTDKILAKGHTIEKIEKGMVLYAVWKENPAVSYNANGGIFSMNIEKTRYAKDATVKVNFDNYPHRTGYTFMGWSTKDLSDDGSTKEYKKGATESFKMPEKDVTLSAIWKADEIDVYYDLDSDYYYTVEATNGDSKTLWDPTKVGLDSTPNTTSDKTAFDEQYSFVVKVPKHLDVTGFAVYINGAKQKNVLDESDTSCYKYTYTVSKVIGELDVTIGGAEKIYYSIKYHLEGGSLKTEESSSGTTPVGPELDEDGNPVGTPPEEHPENNATLVNEYVFGEGVELPTADKLVHTGYTFGGWYLDSAHTKARTSILTTDSGNLTVYAKWDPITYTIKYDLNGGSDVGSTAIHNTSLSVKYNEEVVLPTGDTILSPVLTDETGTPVGDTPQYYDFLGWSTDADDREATYPAGFDIKALTDENGKTITLYAIWATPESQLSLDANGGQYAITEDGIVKNPTMITKQTHVTRVMGVSELAKPARTGYTFKGWSKTSNGSATYTDEHYLYITKASMSLYAVWEPATYEVTFDYNVVDGDIYKYQVYQGSDLKKDIGGTAPAKLTQSLKYDEMKALNANTYGVIRYDVADTVKKHPTVMKFAGWATAADAIAPDYVDGQDVSNLWNPDDSTKKVTLYAVWTEDEVCYLNYDANGGTWTTGKEAVAKPVAKNSSLISTIEVQPYDKTDVATTPQRTGYTFVGWDTDASKAAAAVTYTKAALDSEDAPTITVSSTQSSNGMTLYAIWTPNTYKIVYSNAGDSTVSFTGSGTSEVGGNAYDTVITLFGKTDITKAATVIENEETSEEETSEPEEITYTLLGWATTSGASVPVYQPGAKVINLATGETGSESITLYPVWKATKDISADDVWLYYDANGGSSVAPTGRTKASTVTLAAAPAKTGYTFTKWKIDGNEYDAGSSYTITADVTAVAQWTAKNYDINYVLNNATVTDAAFETGKATPQVATYDTVETLYDVTDVNATKYTLLGWSTSTTGGVVYQPGQSVKNLATGETDDTSITLYAVWKENVATYITYNANGGKFASNPVATKVINGQTENVKIKALDGTGAALTPTKTGYEFGGWNTKEDGSGTAYTDGAATVAASTFATNTTLFAVWTPKTYYIVYDANDTRATFTDTTNATDSRIEGSGAEKDEYKRKQEVATYDAEVQLYKATDITLPKHKLKGWATEPQGDIVYQPYQAGQNVKNLATDSIELYAVWESMGDWKIRYHANGGENAPAIGVFLKEEASDGVFEASAQISNEEPVRDGYIFKGWSTDKTATTADSTYVPPTETEAHEITLTSDLILYAVWEKIIVYGVSYDANGGAGKCPFDTNEYTGGKTVEIIFDQQPTKAGYQFLGWSTDKDAKTAEYTEGGTKTFDITANTQLFAVWKENTYSLKFYKGDSSVDANLLTGAPYNEYADIPFSEPIVMPEYTGTGDTGMVFAGWATSDGGEAVFTTEDGNHDSLVSENEGTLNLYVAWKPVVVNVTITDEKTKSKLAKDETIPVDGKITFEQTYGEAMPNISVEPCVGYNFEGIYNATEQIYDKEGQPKGSSAFVNDTTLKAKWTAVSYKINYEQLGNVISSETLTYDQLVKIRGKADIKNLEVPSGYDLVGWSLLGMNDISGTVYKPGDILTNNELYKNGSDITLYPIIQVDQTYSVVYNANGGSKPPMDNTPYKFGDKATVKTTVKPVKEGYTFAGWHDLTNPDVVYEADKTCEVQVKSNLTLYAVWNANEYQICYHNNFGSSDVTITDDVYYDTDDYSFRDVHMLEETVEGGDDVSLKRTGCTLLGWSTSKSGSVSYDPGSEMYQPLTRKQNQTVDLYAVWEKDPYTITYAKNEPADAFEPVMGVMLNQAMSYDDEQRLYNNRYTLTGYDFLGWATTSNATEAQYADEEIVKNLTDEKGATVTLYAVWSLKELNVEFKVQGHGTAPEKQIVPYGELVTEPEDMICEGYLFKGWYKDSDYSENWDFETDKVVNDVAIYAKWNEIVATVQNPDGTVTAFDNVQDAIDYAASTGEVTTVTLKNDISVDSTLTIPENVVLDIETYKIFLEKFATIVNNYIIKGTGSIEGEGTLNNNGKLEGVTVGEGTSITGDKNPTPDPTKLCTVEFISKGVVVKTYEDVISNSHISEPEKPAVAGFAGWYKDEDCTEPWNFDTDYVTDNTKLYAKYTEFVEVSFNANGGTFKEAVAPLNVAVENRLNETELLAIADKLVYGEMKFSGWFKDALCKEPWDYVVDTATENTVLYAGWGYPAGHEEVAELSVTKVADYVYTGKKITPVVSVSFGGKVLVPGVDYTVKYKNNIKAYTGISSNSLVIKSDGSIDDSNVNTKAPLIIIAGKKNYSSKAISLNFNILPVSLGNGGEALGSEVTADINDYFAVNKKAAITVKGTVSYKGKKLKSSDYSLSLEPVETKDATGTKLPAGVLAKQQIPKGVSGTFKLTVTGNGNYGGSFVKTITVAENAKTLENVKIKINKIPYSGRDLTVVDVVGASKGALTVKAGGKTLTYGTDYTVEFADKDAKAGSRTNAGIYPVVIKGKGAYAGSRMADAIVVGIDIKNAVVTLENAKPVYTGSHIGANIKSISINSVNKSAKLTAGIDYDVAVTNDIKVGTAKVTITGKGIYSGTKKISYKIQKKALSSDMLKNATISENTINLGEYDYYGGVAVTPDIDARYNEMSLINPADYTISVKNNKNAGSTATVTIKGKGNYTGILSATFTIGEDKIDKTKTSIAKAKVKAKDQVYTGRAVKLNENSFDKIEIKGLGALEYGKDYEIVDRSYVKNVNVGKAQVVIKGKGAYDGYKLVSFRITKKDLKWWQRK